ncbi:MAG: M15 family peptidase [Bacteroidetes bacterium]|nr:MAG: M15 family peptidase [Bacteroidota bacterium]
MSYKFGKSSMAQYKTLDHRLQRILDEAIQLVDFTILEGHRPNERQAQLLAEGKSKLGPGQSKHNANPSLAVDIAPYPIDWDNAERFAHLAGICIGIASQLGIKLRWGGDWDMDGELSDNRFNDLPHLEIV